VYRDIIMSATRLPSAVSRVGAVQHDLVKKRIILTSNNRIVTSWLGLQFDKTVMYIDFNRGSLRTSAPFQRGHEHYMFMYIHEPYLYTISGARRVFIRSAVANNNYTYCTYTYIIF